MVEVESPAAVPEQVRCSLTFERQLNIETGLACKIRVLPRMSFHCGFLPQSAPVVRGVPRPPGKEKKMGLLKEHNNRRLGAPWDDDVTLRRGWRRAASIQN